jgi:two-component system phosphate regulon response regulator PhoB
VKRILLVEDDASLGATLLTRLKKDYEVLWAKSAAEATSIFHKEKNLDLVLLDVGLPDGNGFDLAKKFRAETKIQFLFLTAQSDAESRLKGFELGAEEYIPKPFHLKELLIRVERVLEFRSGSKQQVIELSECTVNFDEMSVRMKDGKIEYPTLNEMKLLQFLIDSAPAIVSRDGIIDEIWGLDKNPSHRSIDNMILHLRHLLGRDGEERIRTVRGVGYQWKTD